MRRFLVVFFVLWTVASPFAANLPVKRYALFVGANQGGAAQQPLQYAQKDALKMQQVMQEVGGVTASDRILLLDPTPGDVQDALGSLARRMVADASENRRTEFLFYYSGHSDEEGLLLGDKALSYKGLRDGLQAIPADVRIAILDSCSSGAFARLKGGVLRAPFLEQDNSQMKGHAFLTSSSENEASQESDTLQGSFFTHYLVSGLRGGADRLGDGLVSLDEAYAYAFQNTLARTESTRAGPQHPSYEIQLSGTGNLILSDVKASQARLDVGSDVAGKLYVRNLSGLLFAEVAKEVGTPLSLAFPPGIYSLTAVTAQKSLTSRVTLSSRGPTMVEAKDFQEQELSRFAVRGNDPDDSEEEPLDEADSLLYSLGFIPGIPGSGWGGKDKVLALAALVDLSQSVRGLQASGLISINSQGFDGIQASGIGSISSGTMRGAQFGGVFNISGGEQGGYWQNAGVVNVASGTFRGVQSAGVVNIANDVVGIQTSGVVNIARHVQGFQVGLVNINSGIDGAGAGLVFISPDAFYHPTLLFDNLGRTHALFQWGMGWLYWMAGAVADSKTSSMTRTWDQLGGLGIKVNGEFAFLDVDAGWMSRFSTAQYTGGTPYIRAALGTQSSWAALEVGFLGYLDPTTPVWTSGLSQAVAQGSWFAGVRFF